MILLLGLFFTAVLGFLIITILKRGLVSYEKAGLIIVIGLGLMTKLLFILDILKIKYSPTSIIISLLIVDLGILLCIRHKIFNSLKDFSLPSPKNLLILWHSLSFLEKGIVAGILFLLSSTAIEAVYWPVWLWDAIALYDYRGKLFADAGGIFPSMALSSILLHTYPPMTSLAHTFVYVLGGKLANPQFIYPLFYIALLLTFYASVRKYCPRWISLMMSLFLLSIPAFIGFAANAYTNLPYAFYFGMGTVYLYRFMKEERWSILVIAGLLLGFAGWTRTPTEQFFLVNLFVLIVWSLWKRKLYFAPIILTLLFVVLSIDWRIYVATVMKLPAVGTEVTGAVSLGISSAIDLSRLINVCALLIKSISPINGGALFLILLVPIISIKSFKENFWLLCVIFGNLALFAAGSYMFSLSWPDWKDSITNSADRLSMIFPPITLYYLSITIPYFRSQQNQNPKLVNKSRKK